MAPSLEALAKKNVAVLKVEIGKWGTPVAKQYDIHGIPFFQVYDASGRKIAEGDAAWQYIDRMSR